ncbi:MAG: hypothetical protein ACD_30C00035G0003 [uncultured bacterium]|uniref:Uncharacterized protein n=4 Tax=Microgenomates group TaxID=1794810 RepID=A0A1F5K4G4_9BACT|nr:MAG: hypothetical protein ACD_30C00035G0003 [uncultured bacterium]KKQ16144.1 MAG: hypothetical protein US28_C0005G0059 [Candidatus Daviesbacteria bacterium GW2011_GWA1_36_8]KKQ75787.1 MAG: hypothetical protein US96_C0004G0010 [Candidatus Woesebacteria bacterium GW2011_GWB1_38_5b]OGE16809.1 MAG: hypothetical protein A2858_02805 [Candidatus Daviesbacteria bacterium RIFCSPHIGHO2_01_FULL_36_37]OGE32931.1 MAG: hypothetical protein A3C99_00010 [Candidatus Daviesbacteria bacterium RIFCSPHIGHO2_02_F
MTFKSKVLTLSLLTIFLVAAFTVLSSENNPFDLNRMYEYRPGYSYEIDQAVNQAQTLYAQKKALKEDLTNGPCLTNDLMTGWVVDLVHNPRQPIDNNEQYQCQAYREGRATHFVELDLNGEVVRVK